MATFIEYRDGGEETLQAILYGPVIHPVGYLNLDPRTAFREIWPRWHVAEYLGIPVPFKSEYSNYNHGLVISEAKDGLGLTGTIELLSKHEFLVRSEHERYSTEKIKEIADKIKNNVGFNKIFGGPMKRETAEKCSQILEELKHPMTVEELIELSTPKDYYAPRLNGGF